MVYLVCGFNAHGQLRKATTDDIYLPRRLDHPCSGAEFEIIFAGWSESVLQGDHRAYRAHSQTPDWEIVKTPPCLSDSPYRQAFGDHNGLVGAVRAGQIYMLEHRSSHLVALPGQVKSQIDHIALAGNGRIAISFCKDPETPASHILEIGSIHDLEKWQHGASSMGVVHTKYTLPDAIQELTANVTTFACLLENGDVYTWGDARHGSLGRITSGENVVEADLPGIVEALEGIKIVKISSGGWMHAALSESGAAYVWGSGMPGKTETMTMLTGLELSEVRLVEIPDDSGEPLDVVDIAVGDGHLVLVTEKGTVYSVGDNSNGQLGVGRRVKYAHELMKVDLPEGMWCSSVQSGPKSTFFRMRQDTREKDEG